MPENKKVEYRLKRRRKPVILHTIGGRLFNFGTKGAFSRTVPETKEGDDAYAIKIYAPGQDQLKEIFKRGKQKVVTEVDLAEEEKFLKEQEALSAEHNEQVTTAQSENKKEVERLKEQLKSVQEDKNLNDAQRAAKVKILKEQIEKFS